MSAENPLKETEYDRQSAWMVNEVKAVGLDPILIENEDRGKNENFAVEVGFCDKESETQETRKLLAKATIDFKISNGSASAHWDSPCTFDNHLEMIKRVTIIAYLTTFSEVILNVHYLRKDPSTINVKQIYTSHFAEELACFERSKNDNRGAMMPEYPKI